MSNELSSAANEPLAKGPANYTPLSPMSFLRRSAQVYPDKTAIIHGNRRESYADFFARSRRLASALAGQGIGKGDTVAVMAPNIPEMLECHFGIPVLGAILNAINIRLDAATVAFILEHGGAKVFIADRQYAPIVRDALEQMANPPIVIDINDPQAKGGGVIGDLEYETFIAAGDPEHPWQGPADEWESIALNYTSGTTATPKVWSTTIGARI